MNSWQIIKWAYARDTRPGSIGRMRQLLAAADLFVQRTSRLRDEDEAVTAFNDDMEVGEAFLTRMSMSDADREVIGL